MPNTARTHGKKDTRTLLELAQKEPVLDFMGRLGRFRHITNEKDHDAAIALSGHLMDIIDDQPEHPLLSLLDFVADGIREYEGKIYTHPHVSPTDMLGFLMEQHGLKPADLAGLLGGEAVVSDILNGKRELSQSHIEALSKRFSVSPAIFF